MTIVLSYTRLPKAPKTKPAFLSGIIPAICQREEKGLSLVYSKNSKLKKKKYRVKEKKLL